MFKKLQNHNDLRKANIEEIIRNLEKFPAVEECEYVFIDILRLPNNISFLKNKIIITQNNLQDFLMFEYNKMEEDKIREVTKINFRQIVDLVILLDSDNVPKEVDEIIDEDTIISKYLGNNTIYIEDVRNNMYMIVTGAEKIVLRQRGAHARIEYYENQNA